MLLQEGSFDHEKIFAPYGKKPMSNGQFLMDYGFVLEGLPSELFLFEAPSKVVVEL